MHKGEKAKVINQGFTIIEIIIVILLLAILLSVTGFVFTVSLRAWDVGYLRGGIREDMNYAIEKVVRDLREIANGSLGQYDSGSGDIDHTIQFDDTGGNTYVLYLYNPDDPVLNSTYNKDFYNLFKADIDQGDDPDSGEGVLILRDLVSPDDKTLATALTIDPNATQVTLDFVLQRSDETVRIRTKVRPRNL